MSMKLFVRNIPYSFTDDQLREVFEAVAPVVSAKVVTDRETGASRGFGFVEMADFAGGKLAIEKLNGHEVEGRALVVDKARDNPREGRGGGGEYRGGGEHRGGGGGEHRGNRERHYGGEREYGGRNRRDS